MKQIYRVIAAFVGLGLVVAFNRGIASNKTEEQHKFERWLASEQSSSVPADQRVSLELSGMADFGPFVWKIEGKGDDVELDRLLELVREAHLLGIKPLTPTDQAKLIRLTVVSPAETYTSTFTPEMLHSNVRARTLLRLFKEYYVASLAERSAQVANNLERAERASGAAR